jgi:hypothetical protein
VLHGVILQEGRAAAGGRAELFAPGAVVWPSDGIGILPEHRGTVETRAVPTREPNGEIRIATKATPALFAAMQAGRRSMSVEFTSLEEVRTAAGVREIRRAMVSAAALTDRPEYEQTAAELRERSEVRVWL